MSEKYCTICGNKFSEEDLFCSRCGSSIHPEGTKTVKAVHEPRVMKERHPLEVVSFFGVYLQGRTYLNLLYLLLLFPLGIAYFVYTVTCFSVSVGLLVTIFGIFLLYLFLITLPPLMKLQAWLMKIFVGMKMEPQEPKLEKEGNFIKKALNALKNIVILKAFAYFLIVAMPLGIVVFVIMVTLLSISLGFTFSWVALIVEAIVEGQVLSSWYVGSIIPKWLIIIGYIVLPFIGVFLLTATLHLLNRLAIYHGRFVRKLVAR